MNRFDKGSSLIELVLSLTIISIIIGMVTLNTDALDNIKFKREVHNLMRDINTLRIQAMKTSKNSKIIIDNLNNNYSISYTNRNKDRFSKIVYPKYLKISSDNYQYEFNETGAPAKAGTITIRRGKEKWDITISVATGKVNLKK